MRPYSISSRQFLPALVAASLCALAQAEQPESDQAAAQPAESGSAKNAALPYAHKELPAALINTKSVPAGLEDLKQVQQQLQQSVQQGLKAVVGLQMGAGFGSGVIVSQDGLIMTAAHVTGGVGTEFDCVLPGGKKVRAVSLGLDSENDAALAKIITPGKYDFVEIEKQAVQVGDWVFSLGHSGGYDKQRGPGLRLGRVLSVKDHAICSDCRLIGGDSGGPQFNMQGRLIGIHSRVGMVLEDNVSVPMSSFERVWGQMLESQFIGKGPFAQQQPAFFGALSSECEQGLKIEKMAKDGAAQKAGLQVGDIITSLGGKPVKSKDEFSKLIAGMSAGAKVQLGILRADKALQVEVKLGTKPQAN